MPTPWPGRCRHREGNAQSVTPDSASEAKPNGPAAPIKPYGAVPPASTAPTAGTPLLSPPRVLRLWLAPWVDEDGDLHDQAYLYVMWHRGEWQLGHTEAGIRSRFAPIAPIRLRPCPCRPGQRFRIPRPCGKGPAGTPATRCWNRPAPPNRPRTMSADALAFLRRLWRPARTDFTDSAYLPSTLAEPSPMPVFDRLADWLPYSGWLPEERLFLLERPPGARRNGQDPVEAVGFVLALNPQTGADARMAAVLKSIFNGLPTGASLQFHLLGTPDIHDFLDRYRGLRSVGGIHARGPH
jgi:hypothetical protein